jgi:hypothetical protein
LAPYSLTFKNKNTGVSGRALVVVDIITSDYEFILFEDLISQVVGKWCFYLNLAYNSEVCECGARWTGCGETEFRIVVGTQEVGSAIFKFILNLV